MKDTWIKPKEGRIKGERWGWLGSGRGVGWGGVVERKWRQLYLNNLKHTHTHTHTHTKAPVSLGNQGE